MRRLFLLAVLMATAPVAAQVQSRPTDPPLVTAANESWYVLREPITVGGDLYYPAGATVFFNGNTMVRSGHFNGVPIYTDTTLEPFSVVLVPVTRGQMQPYEKPRSGALAGTTGSRAPSFPVRVSSDVAAATPGGIGMAPGAPTAVPQTPGAIGVYTPEPAVPAGTGGTTAPVAVGTAGSIARRPAPRAIVSLMRPQSNDGLWIMFNGQKWISRGAAVPIDATFAQMGDYAGFPVYTRRGESGDTIYVPTRAGLAAPFVRK
jgi:hypothetical protein